jgi:glycosyltransferase involved in cell wall biosynthesis
VFARGGFDYYLPILRDCKNAYKVRYGAGRRYMPEPEIDYQLILVDTEKQKADVLAKYPKANVHLFIKPAASHFKPVDVEKEYDVCYIANGQQAAFKGIQWVYETVPKNLRVLHLGYPSKFKPPENVTCKRVDRIDMPTEISRCKIGVLPYDNIDSAPRALVEMIACGLYVVTTSGMNYEDYIYTFCEKVAKKDIWDRATFLLDTPDAGAIEIVSTFNTNVFYERYLSIPVAAAHIKTLIKEAA